MANCHNLFQDYNTEISINKGKRDKMTNSKDSLREKIKKHFKDKHAEYEPKFYIQGSYKMKSGIRTKDDVCDLDDGVYFFKKPDVTSTTLQSWVRDAVEDHTETPPEHRKKCIRNIFAGDYEIDMPVYYKIDGEDYKLAIKNVGWENSDPKAMIDWFNGKKDNSGKLLRIVKYLKAWGDFKRNRMPNGLAMTILAAKAKDKIVLNDRDDISLKDILKEIKKAVDIQFECIVPVTPNDNLFADYDEQRKTYFKEALTDFIADADEALKEQNQLKASQKWRKHLGERFPEGEDKKEENRSNIGLVAGASTSNPWSK